MNATLDIDVCFGKPLNKTHKFRATHQYESVTKDELLQVFAKNLERAMRVSDGLDNQTALAKRSGIAQTHISRLLRARSAATLDTIAALSEALGMQPWELLVDEQATRKAIIERMIGPHGSGDDKVLDLRRGRRLGG